MDIYALFGLTFTSPFAVLPNALDGEHNYALVAVSYAIAVIAAFAAINISYSILQAESVKGKAYWLLAGAVSLGAGIWAMHFIGMMAFNLPMGIEYDPIVTAFSVVPAVIAAAIALAVMAKPDVGRAALLIVGAVTGAGIGAMHYIGMHAMVMDGQMLYEPVTFSISIVLAVVLATVALSVPRGLLIGKDLPPVKGRMIGSLVMAAAITGMHYTGMSSVSFIPAHMPDVIGPHTDTLLLAAAAGIITAILAGVAIFATMVDHLFRAEREHHQQFEHMVGLSADLILIVRNGIIRFANKKAHEVLGSQALVDRPLAFFISTDYALLFDAEDSALADMAQSGDILPMVLASPSRRNVDVQLAVNRIEHQGEPAYFLEFKDVTAVKESARKTLEREASLSAIMNGAVDGIVTMYPDGTVKEMNRAAQDMFRCEDCHERAINLVHFLGGRLESIEKGSRELPATRADGSEFPLELSVNKIHTDEGPRLVAILRDITERRKAEGEIQRLASTDIITGLPNRLELIREIENHIATGEQAQGAVLFVATSGHRGINDSLGHVVTEKLMRAIGERMNDEFDGEYIVGSWGAGDFLVVLKGVTKVSRVERVCATIHDLMSAKFHIDGNDITIACDIGVSRYPIDTIDATNLVRGAGLAMVRGKADGMWPMSLYSEALDRELAETHQFESDLERALDSREIQVFYQPKIDLEHGGVQGMEALVRWSHPTLGMVSPVQFIPVAERTGLIVPIGAWVLRQACRDTKAWVDEGYDLKVAVNLSGRQFEDDGLIDTIKGALTESGLDARHLELEITESALMDDIDAGLAVLNELRALGITIAIDDFGTGYSSLSYLKKLPVDTLKIDQSFVRHVTTDLDDAAIATTIVGMATCLNLKVVAEGIETQEHEKFLKDLTCEIGQGYLYSKPVPAAVFSEFLHARQAPFRHDGPSNLIDLRASSIVA